MSLRARKHDRAGEDAPIVIVTGASGNLGRAISSALSREYRVVGLDRNAAEVPFPTFATDFSNAAAVELALVRFRERYGSRIVSVVHLAAYFDQSGQDHPLYESVNVEGTRHLLRALQAFEVDQFVYASTLLVHAPCKPGERITEDQPFEPAYAYPQSKLAAERVVEQECGRIPFVTLRLAGVYDRDHLIPTLAQQIARIHQRDLQGYFYAGSPLTGQSMLHKDDLADAVHRAVDRRATLPPDAVMLIGEPDPLSYDTLQDEIGYLIHGVEDWPTLRVPKPLAAAGVWGLERLEPLIPDAIDRGEKPFIRPYMAMMGDHHYALDTWRAKTLLGWEPKHRLKDELPEIIAALRRDPVGWYKRHGITPPDWLLSAQEAGHEPETLHTGYLRARREEHGRYRWAHFVNVALGTWLITSPPLIGVTDPRMIASDMVAGALVIALALASMAWRATWARWATGAVGIWLLFAPLIFWTTSGAAYLNDTLVGTLVIGFALALPPEPGPSPAAAMTGPDVPPGWTYNPSAWTQRLPIIALALVGLYVSRYLAAYQLGQIDGVWEPFFAGSAADPQNGTEEIITSPVAEAWPISDGGLGGITYILEILTGVIGLKARWRTMPWLVILFGLLIVPLSVTSISFVIIQPLVIGTWGTLTLVGAAAMLLQIPFAVDELIASLQFVRRRAQAGRNWLRVLLMGDTDTGNDRDTSDTFDRPLGPIVRDSVTGGVSLPPSLALSALIGTWLLFTRLTLGSSDAMANADHVIGFLVLTTVSIAAAEATRAVRFLNMGFGAALIALPFWYGAPTIGLINGIGCGVSLILLSWPRGPILQRYGRWDRLIV
ncbi:NAD-dependent epimerase/dehydratase family protein [Sphingomonas corticis]|uniref:NAD-dependent epimerase/dehydratase family protein n=1 Tax=Sphingomonas corticis TaxID=2722791 RepID=A0ABX1CS16_9SPHN|nr:NAD-dependent epimerase/dehydratase family protein [Sphingomonas corticis]NJR80689.1 NAD-dependent epimerase/dehydratase family protein [Sphingomonas corticis]